MHCHVQMCGATLAFAHTSRAPLRAWRCLIAGIGRARISQAARRLHALLERVEAAIETELSAHIGAPRRHATLRLPGAQRGERGHHEQARKQECMSNCHDLVAAASAVVPVPAARHESPTHTLCPIERTRRMGPGFPGRREGLTSITALLVPHRRDQPIIVCLRACRIFHGEGGERVIESVAFSHIAREHARVRRARVRPRQRPPA